MYIKKFIFVFLLVNILLIQKSYSADSQFKELDKNSNEFNEINLACDVVYLSSSKFDYKSHYVTSLRFALPKNDCLPKISLSPAREKIH